MTAKIINQVPYLRASREYPTELNLLVQESNQAYLDVAQAVNERSIGLYPVDNRAITGNSYFLKGKSRQQSLRQVYPFTTTNPIPHGINILTIQGISPNTYGSFKDTANNCYGAIYGSSVAIAGQVSFYITPNSSPSVLDGNIVILSGAGAPAISSGLIIIEWISNTGNN